MNYLKINQKLWDNKTEYHFNPDFYNVDEFLKTKDSLNPIEIDLLADIKGKKILHLQCHFGMDTLSLSQRGAIAIGIDLSGEAIKKANEVKNPRPKDVAFPTP